MRRTYFPSTDAALLAWSVNFKNLIVASPVTYNLTAAQASTYTGLHNAYASALQTATDPTPGS